MSLFFNRACTIGLELNEDNLRLLQLRRKRKYCQVENLICQPLPKQVMQQGQVKDWEMLKACLIKLSQECNLHQAPVVLGLGADVVSKRFAPPQETSLDGASIEYAVHSFIQQQLFKAPDSLAIDYLLMPGHKEVLVAMTPKKYIQRWSLMSDKLGIKLRVITIESDAMVRALNFLHPTFNLERVGLLYYGDSWLKLVVGYAQLTYCQTWLVTASKKINISQQDISEIKKQFPAIDSILYCGAKPNAEFVMNFAPHFACDFFDIERAMQNKVAVPTALKLSADFFIAFGLALTPCPRW